MNNKRGLSHAGTTVEGEDHRPAGTFSDTPINPDIFPRLHALIGERLYSQESEIDG